MWPALVSGRGKSQEVFTTSDELSQVVPSYPPIAIRKPSLFTICVVVVVEVVVVAVGVGVVVVVVVVVLIVAVVVVTSVTSEQLC